MTPTSDQQGSRFNATAIAPTAIDSPRLSGSPVGRPAEPPRIRTCAINASGSSGVGLATLVTYPLAQSSLEVPVRASPSSSLPVLLPTQVSFRWLVSSVSLPSFLRVVPTPPGAALCSAGSLGSVPPLPRSYCGTPTSPAPVDARFPRTAVPSSSLGGDRTPRFLGSPCLRALAVSHRWSQRVEVRGLTPPCAPVSPSALKTASASTTLTISGLNPTAQRPTVYASRPPSRVSAQDSLPVGGLCLVRSGLSPAGCFPEF